KPQNADPLNLASSFQDEWVGEPFPVSKRKPEEENSKKENAPFSMSKMNHSDPLDIHIEPMTRDTVLSKSSFHGEDSDEGNVLDFIEGALPSDRKEKEDANSNQDYDSQGDIAPNKTHTSHIRKNDEKELGIGPDPALLALVGRLESAVDDAQKALQAGHTMRVAEAANRIASECDAFSFRVLARIARCVEQAGKAGDLTALRDLLPELVHQIERSNIALTQIR
ncbi:MAG: hypothetical protein J5803_05065, partial [Desulfovibrio sp.]|nr:hypothetical protein [Desulfovibrio sp.]